MAEARAEKRGTLRGPPSFRVMDIGRQWRRARHEICGARPDNVVGSQQGRRTHAVLRTNSHHGRIRFGDDTDRRPLAATGAKEKLMRDPQDPPSIANSHPYKRPAERVHDWHGRVHDARTNSSSLMRDGSAEPAKNQLRGFMVPGRGVHDCCTAAVIAGPAQIGPNAARSSARSPAPSLRRTSGEPTAAERRPESRALLGIALHSPSHTWWGRHSATSFSQRTLNFAAASCPRRSRLYGINPSHPDRTRRKDGESVGLAVSLGRATIMKVAARHEAESKIDAQYYWTWRRCRWPTQWACPRALLEVAALGEKV
jgi:hypothetical protein